MTASNLAIEPVRGSSLSSLDGIPRPMEFNLFKTLDGLIDGWCERRALRPLAYLLSAYPGVFVHADQQFQLLEALKNLNRLCLDHLTQKNYIWSRRHLISSTSGFGYESSDQGAAANLPARALIADSSSRNAVSLSSACTTKR